MPGCTPVANLTIQHKIPNEQLAGQKKGHVWITDTEQGEMIVKPILPFELLRKIRTMLAPSVDFPGSH